jgi:hypothetical protein
MNNGRFHGGKLVHVKPRSAWSKRHSTRTLHLHATDSEVIFVPKSFTLEKFLNRKGKGLVVAAYCIKSFNCPEGRFSTGCRENCGLCDMSTIKRITEQTDFDFIIATDHASFFDFLKNNEGKYKRLIAIACPYTVDRIADRVHKAFGVSGFVLPLKGEVCKSKDEYAKGAGGNQRNQTKIDLKILLEIMARIRQVNSNQMLEQHFAL